jgi:hypothetical protein
LSALDATVGSVQTSFETIASDGESWGILGNPDLTGRSRASEVGFAFSTCIHDPLFFDPRNHDGPPYIRARCAACAPRAQLFLANPVSRSQNEEKEISAETFFTFGARRDRAHDAQRSWVGLIRPPNSVPRVAQRS